MNLAIDFNLSPLSKALYKNTFVQNLMHRYSTKAGFADRDQDGHPAHGIVALILILKRALSVLNVTLLSNALMIGGHTTIFTEMCTPECEFFKILAY
jgi:hypothetical protein